MTGRGDCGGGVRLEGITKATIPRGDERVVVGVVLEPGEEHEASAIRRAAFAYMAGDRRVTVEGRPVDARVVESFVSPVDLEIGGQAVSAGAWVLGVRVRDDSVWDRVQSGKLAGLAPVLRKSVGDCMAGVDTADARVKVERVIRGMLLKPEQKADVGTRLARAVSSAVALLRAVQSAAVDDRALPSPELGRELRKLSAAFSELAMPGSGVAKAGRKISDSRARKFRKALRILQEIAKELGLDGSDQLRVAWPLNINGDQENG